MHRRHYPQDVHAGAGTCKLAPQGIHREKLHRAVSTGCARWSRHYASIASAAAGLQAVQRGRAHSMAGCRPHSVAGRRPDAHARGAAALWRAFLTKAACAQRVLACTCEQGTEGGMQARPCLCAQRKPACAARAGSCCLYCRTHGLTNAAIRVRAGG